MALESSGRGEKLGNRYEGWWVARQLLYVIKGRFRSVSIEKIGDDERGVDLWVTGADGKRDAQQCKADNGHSGKWSIHHLRSRGVLQDLIFQLSRDPDNRFTLVSGVDAPELRSMAERAVSCTSAADYVRLQIDTKELKPAFSQFCKAVELNPEDTVDNQVAYDLLRRTDVHLFPRTNEGRAEVEALAEFLFVGLGSRSLVTFLADYAERHFDAELHADVLLSVLRGQGALPRDLVREPSLVPRMEALTDDFTDSIRRVLIGGILISRPEVAQVITRLNARDSKSITVLHGKAGDGKSTILLEVTDHLRVTGVPFLALRLDRPLPGASARKYGETLDLPASPTLCLAAMAGERPAVLILDQLDAVRWTAAHASAAWEGCRELIAQAKSHVNLRVLLACRTFDWREDPQLKQWEGRDFCAEVPVGLLPDGEVAKIIAAVGGRYDDLDGRQKALLRSPQSLSLWTALQEDRDVPVRFHTTSDLMRAFWRNRREKIAAAGVPSADTDAAINAIVVHMDENGKLDAPERLLDKHPLVARELKSLNVVTVNRGILSFAHQSYLDFLVGERVVDSLSKSGASVAGWIKSHQQSLFRREQLRQVLQLLRDEDGPRYVATLIELLDDLDIRFHLKHLVIQHLGQCDPPTNDEVEFLVDILGRKDWFDYVRKLVLFRKSAWFSALVDRGVLQELLKSDDDQTVDWIMWLLWGWAESNGDAVANLVQPYRRMGGKWRSRLHSVVQLHECENSRALFEIRLELVRLGVIQEHDLWCQKLAPVQPAWCVELIQARLAWMVENWTAISQSNPRRDDAFPIVLAKHHSEWLEPINRFAFREVWDRLVPLLLELVTSHPVTNVRGPQTYFRDDIWDGMNGLFPQDEQDLVNFVAEAGSALAAHHPEGIAWRIESLSSSRARTIQRLALATLVLAPLSLADFAVKWICDVPARFKLDSDRGSGWHELAWQLIRRFAPGCATPTYEKLERTILQYHEPFEFQSIKDCYRQWRQHGVLERNYFGLSQRDLLDALPEERMSTVARASHGVLKRKFGKRPAQLSESNRGSLSADGGFSDAKAARLSDTAWLRLIVGLSKDNRERALTGNRYVWIDSPTVSRQLSQRVRLEPKRFAKLALKVSLDADPHFLLGIINGIGRTQPPETDVRSTSTSWEAASIEDIESVLARFVGHRDHQICIAVAGVFADSPTSNWSATALNIVRTLAKEHPDPPIMVSDASSVGWRQPTGKEDEEALPSDIVTDSRNHVRSAAGRAIAAMITANPARLPLLLPAIESLVEDPVPAVRAAGIRNCVAMLKSDRREAVRLFKTAASDVGPALSIDDTDTFLGWAGHTHLDELIPVMRAMAASTIPAVSKLGASRITCAWLQWNRLHDEVQVLRSGTVSQREGIATVVASWIDHETYRPRCLELLPALFDDEESNVRRIASVAISRPTLGFPGMNVLAHAFVHSRAFRDHAGYLLRSLNDFSGALAPYTRIIFDMCAKFAGPLATESRDLRYRLAGDARYLAPVGRMTGNLPEKMFGHICWDSTT